MPFIDFHTHILPEWAGANRDSLAGSDACFAMLYSNPKSRLATAEDLLHSMDEAEIQISVVLNIGWTSHDLCARTNDYLLEAGCRWPARIIPFCMVQPTARDAALREVERCVNGGARGIGELRPDVQGYSLLDSALLSPLVDMAIAHRLVVLLHASEPVGHAYPGKGNITPEQLYGFARAFPGMTLVCAHWGGGLPFYTLMPEVQQSLSNVYYDTAASQYLYRPTVFAATEHLVGPNRLVFGSDFPLIGQARALAHARSAGLEPEAESALFGETASRLLQPGDLARHG
jgi:predicted TIM-barrel fold metal-dependent hydrolase